MFEKLKIKMLERIERNTIKSTLHYTHKGEVMEEEVLLKRSKLPITALGDWGRIYPPVNEDGSWNLPNLLFGGKKNMVKLIIIGGIVLLAFFAFYDLFQQIAVILNNPCVQTCSENFIR